MRKPRRTILPLLLLLSLLVPPGAVAAEAQAGGGTRAAAAAPVLDGPVFNDPTQGPAQREAVIDQLINLIRATPDDGEIDLAMFQFADEGKSSEALTALTDAILRGVQVRVLLDGDHASPDVESAISLAILLSGNTASKLITCPTGRGCIASRDVHMKFATFSSVVVDGAEHAHVALQTSSNLSSWYETNSYNDAFTLTDASVYADYRRYFADLRSMVQNPDYFWAGPTGSTYKAHFYPRRQPDERKASTPIGSGDTIVNILKLVECHYEDADGVRRQTDIRIVMSEWNTWRLWIAKQLRELRRQGCWVDVVYSAATKDKVPVTARQIVQTLNPPPRGTAPTLEQIQATPCRFTSTGSGAAENVQPHTKIMMIDGFYEDDIVPRVYTGSANFTSMQTQDDSFLRVMGRDTHSDYLDWFYDIRRTCYDNPPQ